MKQIVDFEQAKILHDNGVWVVNSDYVIKKNGRLYQTDVKQPYYNAPTIGELIEWIRENDANWYKNLTYAISEIELIDALVDLAIKIKENK